MKINFSCIIVDPTQIDSGNELLIIAGRVLNDDGCSCNTSVTLCSAAVLRSAIKVRRLNTNAPGATGGDTRR